MADQPRVSIVINTDGRAKPLATCLESLRFLRYPNFEVVVVAGPTRDGTHELCESWGDAIKYGRCPVRNLSQSRNIGIAMAAGDIVAYIDDDAVPEPEWLDDVVRAFGDPQVGVVGGFLHDHTGKTYQWRYGTANRFGSAETDWQRPTPEFNFPRSFNFPHVIGANSIFRREALVAIGGFDEEYEYFLDETDVTVRILDAGWTVAQLSNAFVHHKYMASHIRNNSKVLTSWYSIIKNKAYFALVHGWDYAPLDRIIAEVQRTINDLRWTVNWAVSQGILSPADQTRFEDEASRGLQDGLARGLSRQRKYAGADALREPSHPFVQFPVIVPATQQRCFVFLTSSYPPREVGGVARYIHQLARTLAEQGHQVHVLTAGSDHDRVDFEERIWVHRIVVRDQPRAGNELASGVPANIWNYSSTMLGEALEIAARRKVDAVYAPIWDAEGVAFIGHATFPLVTSLQTTMRFYLDSNPHRANDAAFMRDFAEPMLRTERLLLERSDGIHAISDAIVQEIEAAYGVSLDRSRLWMVPLGLEDWTADEAVETPCAAGDGKTQISFIGRLESRKGVDVVMDIAPALLARHPGAVLEFVGNDAIPTEGGKTWRQQFEARPGFDSIRDRVIFRGQVSEEELRRAYREADIVLAPSRFESFGLVHLEGAMYGKPVVGCRVGGMVEVVEDGVTGVLAEPGDAASLQAALDRLLLDRALRERMGCAGRQRYLARFTPDRMAVGVAGMLAAVTASRRTGAEPRVVDVPTPGDCARAAAMQMAPPSRDRVEGPLRVAMITSVLAPFDAISNDVVSKARSLAATPGIQLTVFAGHNARTDIDAFVVGRMSDLLLTREFLDADLIIYHFGIYYPLFDALLLGNGRAPQAVVFHNITPAALAPASARPVIEKSFAQLQHLRAADAVWADSRENAEMLAEHGIECREVTVLPIAVERPARQGIRTRRAGPVQIVFVGRIVPSKGIGDLIDAVALLGLDASRVRVKIVGNLASADAAFRDSLTKRVAEAGLPQVIEFTGSLSDDERDRLLAESHILAVPSYHEGFCVPVIEALRAGMVPVLYAAHNLRYIADGLCVSSPPGDVPALAAALRSAIEDMQAVLADSASATLRLDRGEMSVDEFERSVAAHLDQFEPGATAQALRALVVGLTTSPTPSGSQPRSLERSPAW